MILQELKKYHDNKRLAKPDEFSIAGYAQCEIPFLIVIKSDGTFVDIQDTRRPIEFELIDKKTRQKKTKTVYKPAVLWFPQPVPRSGKKSYETVFLLWDHIGYVLGYPESDEKSPKQHNAWIEKLHSLPAQLKEDEGVAAMILFYETGGVEKVMKHPSWKDCAKIKSCNIAFQLAGDLAPVPGRHNVKNYVLQEAEKSISGDNTQGVCLVSGKSDETVRTFQSVAFGGEVAKLVSFQIKSGYDSYGKEQGANAPIGKMAESAYITAIKMLLASEQKITINQTTFLFWSETPDPFDQQVTNIMSYNPDRRTAAVEALFKSPFRGNNTDDKEKKRFCILGISPNKARIIVQYWKYSTIGEVAENIREYFNLIEICRREAEYPFLSVKRILSDLAVGKELKNIHYTIERDYIKSIFDGQPFSQSILQAAIRRNRAEQGVTYPRAAIIKACLNKNSQYNNISTENHKHKELTVSLDRENYNEGYLLGRLFAVLEKIQSEANPNINTTIRDRFYGAASGTPASVFSNLMRLKNHHLSKLENAGRRIYFEKLLGEIIDGIKKEFPPHLSLDNQGRFAIGYYHQVQDLFTKKEKQAEVAAE